MNSSTPSPILNLPPEILHKTLIYVSNPIDVLVNFSSTCRDFYEFCQISNSQLAKELFLVNFDPPSLHQISGELGVYDYKEEMKRRTTALLWFKNEETRKSLQSTSPEILEVTLSTLITIAKERLSTSYESLNSILLNKSITPDALASLRPPSLSRRQLRSSSLAAPPLPTSTLSLLSHLQVLSTPSPLTIHSPTQRTRARETVYSRKNFSKNSLYGPFKDDKSGNVDWNKVEALSIVMGCNLRDSDWDEAALNGGTAAPLEIPKGWNSTREVEVGADGEKGDERDWAGVERELSGTYSFLDYRVFESYNHAAFNSPIGSLETESEAVGDRMVLKLKLLPADHVSDVPLTGGGASRGNRRRMEIDSDDEEDEDFEEGSDDENEGSPSEASSVDNDNDNGNEENGNGQSSSSPTTSSPPSPLTSISDSSLPKVAAIDSSSTPPLSFIGTSTPLNFAGSFSTLVPTHMSNRSIRGHVQKTPEGDIRWTMIIKYSGADRWLMSGVQVGASKSAFGILGTWSTAEGDPEGPHGPFMYWPTGNTSS